MSTNMQATLRAAIAPVQTRWAQMSPREQGLVRGALVLLALALVWFVALRPALATLRSAQIQGPQLRAQLQDMLQPSDGKSGLPTAHPLKVMRGAQWVAPTIVGFAAVPKHEETKCALVLITDRGHRCVLSLVQC